MIGSAPIGRKSLRHFLPYAVAAVAGCCASAFLAPILLDAALPFGRPWAEFLASLRLGPSVAIYRTAFLYVPDFVIGLLAGALIGKLMPTRSIAIGSVFGAVYVVNFWVWVFAPGILGFPLPFYADNALRQMFVTSIATFPPLLAFAWLFSRAGRLRRSRQLNGRCLQCGYDLRGSTSDRCAECGTVVIECGENR